MKTVFDPDWLQLEQDLSDKLDREAKSYFKSTIEALLGRSLCSPSVF